MGKPIMAICDRQAAYTSQLIALFQEKKELPFEIHGFTKGDHLQEFCDKNSVTLLVVSEPDYRETLQEKNIDQILVLRESAGEMPDNVAVVNKFQPASALYREIMKVYGECEKAVVFKRGKTGDFKMIGIYSPVHRSLQTTFALTAGQLLARKGKTLYMNFECFSGLEILLGKRFGGNLTDVLYFYDCAREKLPYKLEGIVQEIGGLYMIPPASSYEDFRDIREEEWISIITQIAMAGGYETVLLDLTEQVCGLFSILEVCDRVYTMIKDDCMARAKLAQYELLLEKSSYQKVLEKTGKCKLPVLRALPSELERLRHSEIADCVEKQLREDGFL